MQGRARVQSSKLKIYPTKAEQKKRFANNLVEEIYKGGINGPNIMAVMRFPQGVLPEQCLGFLAAKIIGGILGQLRATGKRLALRVIYSSIRSTIEELIDIGEHAKVPGVEPSIAQPAIIMTLEILNQAKLLDRSSSQDHSSKRSNIIKNFVGQTATEKATYGFSGFIREEKFNEAIGEDREEMIRRNALVAHKRQTINKIKQRGLTKRKETDIDVEKAKSQWWTHVGQWHHS